MTVNEPITTPTEADAGMPILSVRGLKKVYQVEGGEIEAVRNLTFDVAAGELVCVVGPSGAGKTTLLKCIAGLLTPTSGTIELKGERSPNRPRPWRSCSRSTGAACSPG